MVCKGESRSISVLICVKKYVGAVIFIITDKLEMYLRGFDSDSLSGASVRLQLQYVTTSTSLQVERPHCRNGVVRCKKSRSCKLRKFGPRESCMSGVS